MSGRGIIPGGAKSEKKDQTTKAKSEKNHLECPGRSREISVFPLTTLIMDVPGTSSGMQSRKIPLPLNNTY
jgi:hypothetical protein